MTTETTCAIPVVPWLKIPDDGPPYLEGLRCSACEATFVGTRLHCAGCAARGSLEPVRLGSTGRVHTYSIVYRSFPEIAVPYVSAVVDLAGGGTVKGNLLGVASDPERVSVGMAITLEFPVAATPDGSGRPVLTYAFRPAGGAA